jgi:hypothetical protein
LLLAASIAAWSGHAVHFSSLSEPGSSDSGRAAGQLRQLPELALGW